MTATVALARAELLMLTRNRTAAASALLFPLALGVLFIVNPPPTGYVASVATLQLLALVGLTVANTATVTLVARRQQHVLKRWRTSPVSTPSMLLGTLAPACALLVSQAAVLFAATAYATGTVPARPALLALAVVLGGALGCAVAFVTAAFTRTVEAANITMIPAVAALAAGGIWTITAGPGEAAWLMLATGGGALAQLVRLGWHGPANGGGLEAHLAAAGPSVLMLLALTAVAVLVALRTFRWEPRG